MRYDSNFDGMTPVLIALALGAMFVLVYVVGYLHGRYVARRNIERADLLDDAPPTIDGLKIVRDVVRD